MWVQRFNGENFVELFKMIIYVPLKPLSNLRVFKQNFLEWLLYIYSSFSLFQINIYSRFQLFAGTLYTFVLFCFRQVYRLTWFMEQKRIHPVHLCYNAPYISVTKVTLKLLWLLFYRVILSRYITQILVF